MSPCISGDLNSPFLTEGPGVRVILFKIAWILWIVFPVSSDLCFFFQMFNSYLYNCITGPMKTRQTTWSCSTTSVPVSVLLVWTPRCIVSLVPSVVCLGVSPYAKLCWSIWNYNIDKRIRHESRTQPQLPPRPVPGWLQLIAARSIVYLDTMVHSESNLDTSLYCAYQSDSRGQLNPWPYSIVA